MNQHIQIRRAIEKDQDAIYLFMCDLEDSIFDAHLFGSFYIENIQNPNHIYFVAEDLTNNKVIGFISSHGQLLLHHMGFVYEIQEMYVEKSYRNLGIGKMLLYKIKESLPVNCKSLEVTAQNKRVKTHEFYQANGFKNSHLKFTQSFD
jgi:PhnO protein